MDADLLLRPRPSSLPREEFLERFGGIYERSRWVAERAWPHVARERLDSLAALGAALAQEVDAADEAMKLALIRAHPDLAGKAAIAGALSPESREEQQGAGLDRLSPEQFARFKTLNQDYKARFGFPFIIAVRGLNADAILEAFETRLKNSPETEFRTALAEIHKIARLRLEALARSEGAAA